MDFESISIDGVVNLKRKMPPSGVISEPQEALLVLGLDHESISRYPVGDKIPRKNSVAPYVGVIVAHGQALLGKALAFCQTTGVASVQAYPRWQTGTWEPPIPSRSQLHCRFVRITNGDPLHVTQCRGNATGGTFLVPPRRRGARGSCWWAGV